MRSKGWIVSSAVLCALACSSSADAEIVYLSSGRTLSVKGHRAEGESIVLALRGTGPETFAAVEAAYRKFADDPVFRKLALRTMADADRVKAIPLVESALGEAAGEGRNAGSRSITCATPSCSPLGVPPWRPSRCWLTIGPASTGPRSAPARS